MSAELSTHFVGAATKTLSEVEVNPGRSHQHELQATSAIQEFLGPSVPRRMINTKFMYLEDDAEPIATDCAVTYYDARENHPTRSESRLYYPDNAVIQRARAGDLLVFLGLRDGTAAAVIARRGSTAAAQLTWLFNLDRNPAQTFVAADEATFHETLTSVDAEVLLDLLGIEIELPSSSELELVRETFGTTFPPTAQFSEFAREHTDGPAPQDDPDGALMAWWDTEYRLFQAFERSIVESRLATGFSGESAVDDFLRFSLSVQNRRKSRSGHAFEHHLAAVLSAVGVPFERGATTERKSKPDFLLPSARAYADPDHPPSALRMLGAKTTAKDRWRQILTEADRIPVKHLATLQPAISVDQTREMAARKVQLVVPRGLHESFTTAQQSQIWTLSDFINDVEEALRDH